MGFFNKLKEAVFGKKKTDKRVEEYAKGLEKSHRSLKDKISRLFAKYRSVDEEFFAELNDVLIESDVGAALAQALVNETKLTSQARKITDPREIYELLIENARDFYLRDNVSFSGINYAEKGPTTILIVGVNGVGKTTAIAKLAYKLTSEGKKVLLTAGDTFRSGATEQLAVWARRVGADLYKGRANADPSSVIYDGLKKAQEENYDVVICDTAGRVQTKANLMAELSKINRVMKKIIPDAPREAFLILDATMGQNGIYQAEAFAEATDLTGIILTKMDSSSKGGVVLAIKDKLHLPVRYIGLGEKATDLVAFDLDKYLWGLIGGDEQ